jgi:hypothetical protein
MSDRPPRPEWRAAYLSRTLPRPALRNPGGRGAAGSARAARDARGRGTARPANATVGSFPIAITAMLQLVPTA